MGILTLGLVLTLIKQSCSPRPLDGSWPNFFTESDLLALIDIWERQQKTRVLASCRLSRWYKFK